ncbi:MAG: DUF2993 domain-containing protein [Actinobacteria bacterium]|nr:DUF2993 domain-containing protein [Actinomycetota bacterium]
MRKLLVALLVLAVVLIGADVGGRVYAEDQADAALAQHLPGPADPAVSIHGFSFLLQALPGRYSHVTISSNDLSSGPLQHVAAEADLYDVSYPLRSAISGTVDGLTIGRAQLRLTVPATDLGSVLGVPNLTLSSTAGTAIRLHTSVTVAGETVPVTADVAISMTDRTLHLSASALSAGGVSLPSALIGELHRRLTVSVPLPGLPFGVTSAVISVSGGDLVISASATDLRADQISLTS